MQHVKLGETADGYSLDVRPYLGWLAGHAAALPPGARAYALDPEHYDFTARWCPRGAVWESATLRPDERGTSATVVLRGTGDPSPRFVLTYQGVSSFTTSADEAGTSPDELLVDELVPVPQGVRHELCLRGGTLVVVARDMVAGWRSGRADDRPVPTDEHPDPVDRLRHVRTHPGMYLPDESFASLVAFVYGWDLAAGLWGPALNRWLVDRLGAAGPERTWSRQVACAVAGTEVRSERDLTSAQDTEACALAFDVLEEFLLFRPSDPGKHQP
jgi:hypothetical protein